jgi:transcriptional regulator with XRE-family HTH domain
MAERLRRAREEAGLTLRQVADRAGLAPSTVQKVESGKIIPSVAVMVRLADALNRRASFFIEDDAQAMADVRFVPRGSGRRVGKAANPVRFEQIAEPLANPRMEAFLITVKPGGRSGSDEPIIYRGEEIVVCTRGTLVFEMRGQEHRLHRGDTLHFKGDIPHTWYNPGPEDAEMIMVCDFVYP